MLKLLQKAQKKEQVIIYLIFSFILLFNVNVFYKAKVQQNWPLKSTGQFTIDSIEIFKLWIIIILDLKHDSQYCSSQY